jgi:hypothetical protein
MMRDAQITYLDHVIPFAAYTKAREGYNQLRAERKAAHNDVKAAQAAVEPFEALQEYVPLFLNPSRRMLIVCDRLLTGSSSSPARRRRPARRRLRRPWQSSRPT